MGSVINYWVSQWIGKPVLQRYGRYVLVSPAKLEMGHQWVSRFGMPGIFAARLLPVVRHLISIPAGILEMPFGKFSLATLGGAGLWCGVLAWFGEQVIGSHPELLQSPEAMAHVIKAKLAWFVGAVVVLTALYAVVLVFKRKQLSVLPSAL
jgi:membrane protein DedA with SNARE-associated domain